MQIFITESYRAKAKILSNDGCKAVLSSASTNDAK